MQGGGTASFGCAPLTLSAIGKDDLFLAKYDLFGNPLWAINAAAIGLINLIYPATAGARYESRFRIGTAIPI